MTPPLSRLQRPRGDAATPPRQTGLGLAGAAADGVPRYSLVCCRPCGAGRGARGAGPGWRGRPSPDDDPRPDDATPSVGRVLAPVAGMSFSAERSVPRHSARTYGALMFGSDDGAVSSTSIGHLREHCSGTSPGPRGRVATPRPEYATTRQIPSPAPGLSMWPRWVHPLSRGTGSSAFVQRVAATRRASYRVRLLGSQR